VLKHLFSCSSDAMHGSKSAISPEDSILKNNCHY